MKLRWILVASCVIGLCHDSLSARTWTDVHGRTMEGEFDSYDPKRGMVTILRNGKAFRVALEKFSEADIAYVKKAHLSLQKKAGGSGFVLEGGEAVTEFEDRKAFLDYHFAKWPLAEFEKDDQTGKAKLHVLKAQEICVEWQGHYYAGIRFRMPEWLDGDFKWFHIFERKKEHEGRGFVYKWNLHKPINKRLGFMKFTTVNVAAYPDLKALYHPYTKRFTKQGLARTFFKAGEEYVIWMRFDDHDMPDIAYSLGIDSERGNDEYGRLLSDR